ncbi:unnamed protein product [Rotaria sordida]|uniref:Uncharacterized protein n=1 Tax=Rotaria sordida TaxID=392033 RepID=A0A813Q2Q3_9BILA|nr:unnamed protein product [Rotaria sordida]CAF0761110.1 unnamed protein product [Rotaria sordida]CAF0802500.1 unnamed protein product [Rotaria sordida]CAF3533804.1 unnamed protein product [Rotaria sordida]
MLLTKTRTISSSYPTPASATSTGYRKTITLFNHLFSIGSTAMTSIDSVTTPKTGSILSDSSTLDEHDYEITCQIMRDLIEEIQIEKPFISFNDMFLDQDDIIGCLLRIFDEYAENINGIKQITRENMLKLLENSEIFNNNYTSLIFINDWNNLRKQMIKKKIYERKSKALDFCGFVQLIDIIKNHLYKSKDEILKKIIGSQIYNDVIKLKEIRDKIHLGLLPSMNTLINQYNDFDEKQQPRASSTIKVLSKESPKIKISHIFEPWIVRDELDNELMNKLFESFKLASEQFEHGLIRQNVFIQWLRASHAISDTYSVNIIEGVLHSILARNINANIYKLGTDTFEWNGFIDCIRILAKQIHLSLNEFVKKMLTADEFSFQRWRVETERTSLEVGTGKQTSRPWDSKKVLVAVNIMRDVVEESRKLHLTDDERKRLRSLYKEFATFAYRRQSSHLEARLTNSVLSNWMRECRIFDDKYTINELDKDFISILGDFTLNGVYPQGTRDIDFDGFLVLIQTIAAHKHIRADNLVQMIFAGPRSPLQKTAEFNEHMDRTKIRTSQTI